MREARDIHLWPAMVIILCGAILGLNHKGFAYPVMETGIDFCTNGTDRIECPNPGEPFYGQDANYNNGRVRSYIKLDSEGNELSKSAIQWTMVKENTTGLVWEVKTAENVDDTYTWSRAGDYVNQLNADNFGSHSDWRLPTIKELATLIDSGTYSPAIDTDYFPYTSSDRYWSSSSCAANSGLAWYTNFYSGHVDVDRELLSRYVRAVRAGTCGSFDSHFTDNGDGTLTDTSTGLMWEKEETDYSMNWESALEYCQDLDLAGHLDWRLPSRNELQSLVDYSRYSPAVGGSIADCFIEPYWSATPYAGGCGCAWYVYFGSGGMGIVSAGHGKRVRAVRAGQFHFLILSDLTPSPSNGTAPQEVSFTLTASGGEEPYWYLYDFGDGISQSATTPGVSHIYNTGGNYTVTCTVTDGRGNTASKSASIIIDSLPVDITPPSITGLTDTSSPVASKNWTWFSDENATFRYAIDQNPNGEPVGNFESVTNAFKSDVSGKWYIHVQAKDTAGNLSEVVTVYAVLDNDGDLDNDGLPDSWEQEHFGNLGQSGEGDPDKDGLTNIEEYEHKTNPLVFDTDSDGINDGKEIQYGLDPMVNNLDSDLEGNEYVFKLKYDTEGSGKIEGDTVQLAGKKIDGNRVTAIPDKGYRFERWSDGVLTTSRKEICVTENIIVKAIFNKKYVENSNQQSNKLIDIVKILKIITGEKGFSDQIENLDDANEDKTISMSDAVILIQELSGKKPYLNSIDLTPSSTFAHVGDSINVQSVGHYSNETLSDTTNSSEWHVHNSSIAKLLDISSGKKVIECKYGGVVKIINRKRRIESSFDLLCIGANTPSVIKASTSSKYFLSNGIDYSEIIAEILPFDQENGVVADQTTVQFSIQSGNGHIENEIINCSNGIAKTRILSNEESEIEVLIEVPKYKLKKSIVLNSLNNFSSLFNTYQSSSTVLINGYYQAGSKFSLTIYNKSDRTFSIHKCELKNGQSVIGSTTDSSILNHGIIADNESTGITFTLNRAMKNDNIHIVFYLEDPKTEFDFGVEGSFDASSWF